MNIAYSLYCLCLFRVVVENTQTQHAWIHILFHSLINYIILDKNLESLFQLLNTDILGICHHVLLESHFDPSLCPGISQTL